MGAAREEGESERALWIYTASRICLLDNRNIPALPTGPLRLHPATANRGPRRLRRQYRRNGTPWFGKPRLGCAAPFASVASPPAWLNWG